MGSKADNEKLKLIQNKCQSILCSLLREEDNKYCVDCDAKGPRWASWNLGLFLCIRCAGIHRNLGVHISKVKSVNLDTWTPEQVACLQQMGNSQARAVYEANLPEGFRRPQVDPSLEAFIRAKYEQKKYIAKEWVPPPPPKPAFDIEEEKRKEKEKKKKPKSGAGLEIPSLPQHPSALPRRAPSSGAVSPSLKPLKQEQFKVQASEVPGSADLLNLGDSAGANGDDIFNAFLSAPISLGADETNQPSSQVASNGSEDSLPLSNTSTEEADFFNQKIEGNPFPSNKMTKESILSLYGSNICQVPPTQPVGQVYGMPSGVYVSQPAYAQVAVGSYSNASNGSVNAPGSNVPAMFSPYGSHIIPDTRQQNTWIGIPGNGIDTLQVAQGLGQMSQQMTNLQISGQTWNMTGNMAMNSGGLVVGSNQSGTGMVWPTATCTTNQNISNTFWK